LSRSLPGAARAARARSRSGSSRSVRRVTSPEILRSLGRHGDDCRACSHDPRLEPSQDRLPRSKAGFPPRDRESSTTSGKLVVSKPGSSESSETADRLPAPRRKRFSRSRRRTWTDPRPTHAVEAASPRPQPIARKAGFAMRPAAFHHPCACTSPYRRRKLVASAPGDHVQLPAETG